VTPKTIFSQLITLLFIVLIFAQLVNLFIIVGEQRIQARANIFSTAMDQTIQIIQQLPKDKKLEPDRIVEDQGRNGIFFLSKKNKAIEAKETKRLKNYEKTLAKMLVEKNIPHQSLSIALNTKGTHEGHPLFDPKQQRNPKFQQHTHHRDIPPPPNNHRPPKPDSQNNLALQELIISVEVLPQIWLNAFLPHSSIEALTPRILIATSILLVLTLLTAWFFIRRISKPLSTLAIAAESFGRGNSSIKLKETGPEDIRLASQAFNTMQKRLGRILETQRTMLRAVGHDLRTPLTSLRLRSELLPDGEEKEKFIETIDDMTIMTQEILNWAKNASTLEEVKPIDLNALLASIVDDFADQGYKIKLTGFNPIILHIRRIAIKRALHNLIENGLKYGQQVKVTVEEQKHHIDIHIDDKGPGIPEHLLENAVKPFVRLEESRNKKTGGTGLGLSIAKTIIEAEGGELILFNKENEGLRSTICLPKNHSS